MERGFGNGSEAGRHSLLEKFEGSKQKYPEVGGQVNEGDLCAIEAPTIKANGKSEESSPLPGRKDI